MKGKIVNEKKKSLKKKGNKEISSQSQKIMPKIHFKKSFKQCGYE